MCSVREEVPPGPDDNYYMPNVQGDIPRRKRKSVDSKEVIDQQEEQECWTAFDDWCGRTVGITEPVLAASKGWKAGMGWQKERSGAELGALEKFSSMIIELVYNLREKCAELESLPAQVAALREALERLHNEVVVKELTCSSGCSALEALSDTAEAATRYQREQRLEGAREFWKDYRKRADAKLEAGLGASSHWAAADEALAEMEREAGQ